MIEKTSNKCYSRISRNGKNFKLKGMQVTLYIKTKNWTLLRKAKVKEKSIITSKGHQSGHQRGKEDIADTTSEMIYGYVSNKIKNKPKQKISELITWKYHQKKVTETRLLFKHAFFNNALQWTKLKGLQLVHVLQWERDIVIGENSYFQATKWNSNTGSIRNTAIRFRVEMPTDYQEECVCRYQ